MDRSNNHLNATKNELRENIIQLKAEIFQLKNIIECFPGELNQVFMNILSNAAQSIEGQGNIWIKTKILNKNKIYISIQDSGDHSTPEYIQVFSFSDFVFYSPVAVVLNGAQAKTDATFHVSHAPPNLSLRKIYLLCEVFRL